jgi:signal transduction histidine kinase
VEGGLRIENDVPAGARVACEVQDLNEILANLVDNACKHAKTRVRVRMEEGSIRGFVTVVVEDDGPGLPPEAWELVFNVGTQWGDHSRGSGLGLPIVRDLVQLYGGDIRLGRSALGGLRVQLELPEFVQGPGR